MKLVNIAIVASLLGVTSAVATTVNAGGGTAGAKFYTSAGTILTSTNSAFAVGTYNGTIFTQFAAADLTPITISTVNNAAFFGTWSAGAGDTSAAADSFNGSQIWFRVTVTADGGGLAYFSSPAVFPTNAGGLNDAISINSNTLNILGAGSTAGSRVYSDTDNRVIIGVVPEPSVALLGALGVLGLLRRRR